MDVQGRSGRSPARFEADSQGVRIHEPTGLLELRWSVVRAVTLQRCADQTNVALRLRDGSTVAPSALQAVTTIVGAELEELWWRYGPPGASAMWGRPGAGATASSAA
jgi:hypothetical protein